MAKIGIYAISPTPTGSLQTFFSGSAFNPSIDPQSASVTNNANKKLPVPNQATGDKEQFNGSKNVGRTISGTQAYVSRLH